MLSEPIIEKNIRRMVSLDVQPTKATAIFTVRILFDKDSDVSQSFKSQMVTKVKLDIEKEPDGGWLISRVELLAINLQPANWRGIGNAGQY